LRKSCFNQSILLARESYNQKLNKEFKDFKDFLRFFAQDLKDLNSNLKTLKDFKDRYEPCLWYHLLVNSRVVFYFIKITKTVDGGASGCKKCPVGMKDKG
jgi:hypothetical protein